MLRHGYLDGWRGLAVGCVLLAHFSGLTWLDAGRFGVDLFFVLSGLLMSRLLYEQRVPLGEFYRRRLSRVLPAFLAFVLLTFAVCATVGIGVTGQELWSTLSFTRAYVGPPIWSTAAPTQHLWSLNVEEHSYVLLSLVTFIPAMYCRRVVLLCGLAVLTVAVNLWYWLYLPLPNYDLRTECAATCLLYSAGYRTIAGSFRVPGWTPMAALVLAASCYMSPVPVAAKLFFAPPLLAFAVNHISSSVAAVKALETPWLQQLGIWSFSIYLWQQPFFKMKGMLTAPLALVIAVLAGVTSYVGLEQPLRTWLNENWKPGRGRIPAAPRGEAQ